MQQSRHPQQGEAQEGEEDWGADYPRVNSAQMATFLEQLRLRGLGLIDNPSRNFKCGFYAVLSQVRSHLYRCDEPCLCKHACAHIHMCVWGRVGVGVSEGVGVGCGCGCAHEWVHACKHVRTVIALLL